MTERKSQYPGLDILGTFTKPKDRCLKTPMIRAILTGGYTVEARDLELHAKPEMRSGQRCLVCVKCSKSIQVGEEGRRLRSDSVEALLRYTCPVDTSTQGILRTVDALREHPDIALDVLEPDQMPTGHTRKLGQVVFTPTPESRGA